MSIVVPTRERRSEVIQLLGALDEQAVPGPTFDVVVVVDGSGDDTVAAVTAADFPFPLRVIQQPRAGAAAARNAGAHASQGAVLLFLDDDVAPAATLAREVVRALSSGNGDFAMPRMVLQEGVKETLLSRDLHDWLEEVHLELASGGAAVGNIMSAALAVRREVFERLGGFDEDLSAEGRYGAEDAEFGHRLLVSGASFRYLPDVDVRIWPEADPSRTLQRAADVSRGHVLMIRRHPELRDELFGGAFRASRVHRVVASVVLRVPPAFWLLWPVRLLVLRAIRRGWSGRRLLQGWWVLTSATYWRGVASAGGAESAQAALEAVRRTEGRRSGGPLRVLAYHAVADLAGDPLLEEYGVPPVLFRAHLDMLSRWRFHWVTPEEALSFLGGDIRLPARAVLLTFDDGYADLRNVRPLLIERRIPAVVFPVSGHLGGENTWDQALGASPLALLDASELRTLARHGVEIGSHGRKHRSLVGLPATELEEEVVRSAEDLEAAGLGPPRLFAFPMGDHDPVAREAVQRGGYRAAFTVQPGVIRPGRDRFALPRIEIHRHDSGWRFLLKVASAGGSSIWEGRVRGWWEAGKAGARRFVASDPSAGRPTSFDRVRD